MSRRSFLLMLIGLSLLSSAYERDPSTPGIAFHGFDARVASPKLKVDQSNLVTSPEGLGLGNGLYGQIFMPKAKNLAQVDLLLTVNQVPPAGVETTGGLFDAITQQPIATASAFVSAAAPGELARMVSFRFDPPVPLVKNVTYTIGWYGPPDLSWQFSYGDPYPSGQVVLYDGAPFNPPADFVFVTYSLKP